MGKIVFCVLFFISIPYGYAIDIQELISGRFEENKLKHALFSLKRDLKVIIIGAVFYFIGSFFVEKTKEFWVNGGGRKLIAIILSPLALLSPIGLLLVLFACISIMIS